MGKKGRLRGTTYHLVQRPYEERTNKSVASAPVWVSDADFRRGQRRDRNPSRYPGDVEDYDDVIEERSLYADEWNEQSHMPKRPAGTNARAHDTHEEDEGSALNEEWDSVASQDEYDDDDNAIRHAADELQSHAHLRANVVQSTTPSVSSKLGSGSTIELAQQRVVAGEQEKDDVDEADKLFEDEMECEVTDDFLRQLVFGAPQEEANRTSGTNAPPHTDRRVHFNEDAGQGNASNRKGKGRSSGAGPFSGLDEEVIRMLTEEEKSAMMAACHSSGRHASSHTATGDDNNYCSSNDDTNNNSNNNNENEDATALRVGHARSERALEAQFDQVMQEFNADAHLNDAYADDPRMHGPLGMDKYMMALEEFVTDRAGIDLETIEPAKNKGLIHQLKMLAHRAGALDVDRQGGVFLTTVASSKQSRFAAEFHAETERIRREARQRMERESRMPDTPDGTCIEKETQEDSAKVAAATAMQPLPCQRTHSALAGTGEVEDALEKRDASRSSSSEDQYVTIDVKSKADRMDCETAVSAYSTYFNQPNVIRATKLRRSGKASTDLAGAFTKSTKSAKPSSQHEAISGSASAMASREAATTWQSGAAGLLGKEVTRAVRVQATGTSMPGKDANAYTKESIGAKNMHLDTVGGLVTAESATAKKALRQKGETAEDRRLRQKAVKALQRERRQEKSKLKSVYKTVEHEEIKRESTMKTAHSTVHIA